MAEYDDEGTEGVEDMNEVLDDMEMLLEARTRYSQTDSYQARLRSKYIRLHHFYDPLNGDQWPEDQVLRPGKIHITENVVKPLVDIDSRLQSVLPRIANVPDLTDDQSRRLAEAAETMMLRFLDLSGWEVWLATFCQTRSLYGKGILKPYWNTEEKRPDVVVVENPANLRIGWGSSDYTVKDWALYEYTLSPFEVMRRWPDIVVSPNRGAGKPLQLARIGTHDDPLSQKLPPATTSGNMNKLLARPTPYQPSDYEDKQVPVWDYWYKHADGTVCNAIIVGEQVIAAKSRHPEYPDIPYIVAENDHVPGSPEGVSVAEPLLDLQIEFNRALSHWAQLVADEVDPAFQLTGDNADAVPAGIVPKGGEIVAAGTGNEIKPIVKGVNQFPLQQLIERFWEDYHRISGFSEILFGQTPSADISGRALAVQVQAAINRLDPRRRRLYQTIRDLLGFWTYMVKQVNPKISFAGQDGQVQELPVRDLFDGTQRWKIVAPEITPRDLLDSTTNVANKVNAKLVSLKTGMDELGVDAPEKEIDIIRQERSDPHLFPGDVNAYVAVVAALAQVQQQQAAMQQTLQQMQGQAQGQLAEQGQTAAPNGFQGDNGASPPQPATAAGGPPPAGGQGPIAGTTLVRAQPNGGAQTLNQLAIRQSY